MNGHPLERAKGDQRDRNGARRFWRLPVGAPFQAESASRRIAVSEPRSSCPTNPGLTQAVHDQDDVMRGAGW